MDKYAVWFYIFVVFLFLLFFYRVLTILCRKFNHPKIFPDITTEDRQRQISSISGSINENNSTSHSDREQEVGQITVGGDLPPSYEEIMRIKEIEANPTATSACIK